METLPSQDCCLCHHPLPSIQQQINGVKTFTVHVCCGAAVHNSCQDARKKRTAACPTCKKSVPTTPAKSVKLLRKHVKKGVGWAQYMLSQRYSSGRHGVPQSYERAAQLMELAGANGVSGAWYQLGLCYKLGQGVLQNDAKALDLYTQAAEQGQVMAMTNLGIICYQSGEKDKGLEWTTKAANLGHVRAQQNLTTLTGMPYRMRCFQGVTGEDTSVTKERYFAETCCSSCGKEDQSAIVHIHSTNKKKPFLKCPCKSASTLRPRLLFFLHTTTSTMETDATYLFIS